MSNAKCCVLYRILKLECDSCFQKTFHDTKLRSNSPCCQVLNFLSISILCPVGLLFDCMSVYEMIFRILTLTDHSGRATDRIPTSLIVWDYCNIKINSKIRFDLQSEIFRFMILSSYPMTNSCKHQKEHSSSIKSRESLDQLSDYYST